MACTLTLTGAILIPGDACPCPTNGASQGTKSQPLEFGCPIRTFGAAASTDCPQQLTTPGAVGDNFVPLPAAGDIGTVELLFVSSTAPIKLRLNASAPTRLGVGGTFPTSFGGGETFTFRFLDKSIVTLTVAVTFTAGAQSAQDVVNEINAAAALAGAAFQPAAVDTSGQIRLTGPKRGPDQDLEVTVANATVGFAATTTDSGTGDDIDVNGTFLNEFGTVGAGQVDVSGNAQITVLAAGAA